MMFEAVALVCWLHDGPDHGAIDWFGRSWCSEVRVGTFDTCEDAMFSLGVAVGSGPAPAVRWRCEPAGAQP